MIRVDPTDAVPIWRQIEEGVQLLIAAGRLAAGAGVPSVRELARELQVNPATVSKAYQRLVEAGQLVVRRGEGTFVASEAKGMDKRQRQRLLGAAADRYVVTVRSIAADDQDAVSAVTASLQRIGPSSAGGKR